MTGRMKNAEVTEKEKKTHSDEVVTQTLAGQAAGVSVNRSVRRVAETYRKPETYNRKLYDDGVAKRQAKMDLFSSGRPVKDPYSGDELVLHKQTAKLKYGEDWQKHLAEADHIEPVHKVYEEHKNDAFLANEDIRETVNGKENLKTISRKQNNAKRDRNNEKFYGDEKYLKDKDISLSRKSRERAMADGRKAKSHIDSELAFRQVKNAAKEFHRAGAEAAAAGAVTAAGVSAFQNIIAVLKGEKTAGEALEDIATTTGKTAAMSYVTGGAVTVTTQWLSHSSSQLAQLLGRAGAPGMVVTAVMTTAGTVKRYIKGEISTEECIVELGEAAPVFAASSYGALAGQVVIPVPVVGAIIGSMVGGMLGAVAFNGLSRQLQAEKMARERRIRIEKECGEAVRVIEEYRKELNALVSRYFAEHRKVFDEALENMDTALQMHDADGLIHAANRITTQLGGRARNQNTAEFDELMKSDDSLTL